MRTPEEIAALVEALQDVQQLYDEKHRREQPGRPYPKDGRFDVIIVPLMVLGWVLKEGIEAGHVLEAVRLSALGEEPHGAKP